MKYLVVDAMMSGTGVRDACEGGYRTLPELGLSPDLTSDLGRWLADYGQARSRGYGNAKENRHLDAIGIELCKRVMEEIPGAKAEYFSDALCRRLHVREGS